MLSLGPALFPSWGHQGIRDPCHFSCLCHSGGSGVCVCVEEGGALLSSSLLLSRFWFTNQPDNWQHRDGQDEDCVHLQQYWNDNNCNALHQWICKKPISQGVAWSKPELRAPASSGPFPTRCPVEPLNPSCSPGPSVWPFVFPALSFYLTRPTRLPRRTLWDEQLLEARALLCFCICNQCRPVRQQVFNKHLWTNRSFVLVSATVTTLPSPGVGSPSSVSLLLKQAMAIARVPCISFAADGPWLDFPRPSNHSQTSLSCGWSHLVFRLLLSLALASSCDPIHPSWDYSAFCQLSLE